MMWLFVLFCCGALSAKEADFTGNNLTSVINEKVNSSSLEEFKSYWMLDSHWANPTHGIRLITSGKAGDVDTIVFAGYGYSHDGVAYLTFANMLPFDIKFYDNVEVIKRKMEAAAQKEGNEFLFRTSSICALVHYVSYGKIRWIKFFTLEGSKKALPDVSPDDVPPARELASSDKETQAPAPVLATADPDLEKAVMEVFHSWRSSLLVSIQGKERKDKNLWSYKYTYATSVHIPGELFNMVYRFPFADSQLDFVSVLKQSDHYDDSFEKLYHTYAQKLAATFTEKDGWTASVLPNTEGNKLSDMEFRNDRLGAIVLDFSRNPKGRNVLYLRFLLYSN